MVPSGNLKKKSIICSTSLRDMLVAVSWLVFCQLDRSQSHLERETLAEKRSLTECPIGKSVGHFLDYYQYIRGPSSLKKVPPPGRWP